MRGRGGEEEKEEGKEKMQDVLKGRRAEGRKNDEGRRKRRNLYKNAI